MKLPRYELKAEKSLLVFQFISEGPRGRIPKLIKFSSTNLKNLYNLAFGDKNENTDDINDLAISNNGDSEKVLSSVVSAIYTFTNRYPESWIYAVGSTRARTRLYQIGITKYFNEIRKDFHIYGLKEDKWEGFTKGIAYEAFLAKRKK